MLATGLLARDGDNFSGDGIIINISKRDLDVLGAFLDDDVEAEAVAEEVVIGEVTNFSISTWGIGGDSSCGEIAGSGMCCNKGTIFITSKVEVVRGTWGERESTERGIVSKRLNGERGSGVSNGEVVISGKLDKGGHISTSLKGDGEGESINDVIIIGDGIGLCIAASGVSIGSNT